MKLKRERERELLLQTRTTRVIATGDCKRVFRIFFNVEFIVKKKWIGLIVLSTSYRNMV